MPDFTLHPDTFPPDAPDDAPILRPETEAKRLDYLARADRIASWDPSLARILRRQAEVWRRYARMERPIDPPEEF